MCVCVLMSKLLSLFTEDIETNVLEQTDLVYSRLDVSSSKTCRTRSMSDMHIGGTMHTIFEQYRVFNV